VSSLDAVVALAGGGVRSYVRQGEHGLEEVGSYERSLSAPVTAENVEQHLANAHGLGRNFAAPWLSTAHRPTAQELMEFHERTHSPGHTHGEAFSVEAPRPSSRQRFIEEANTPPTSPAALAEIERLARQHGTDSYGRSAAARAASAERLRKLAAR
jgi:hypothetical protein